MSPIDLTTQEYANADVIVTTKEYVRGEPTVPLSLALHTADDQAEHESDESIYR